MPTRDEIAAAPGTAPTADPEIPRTAGRVIFTVAVVVAIGSAAVMLVQANWDAAVRFALIAAAMLATRPVSVPAPFAAAFAVFLLLATWAAVEHWYRGIAHFDVAVHTLTPGSLAAVTYFVLVHHRLLPDARAPQPRQRGWAPVLWVTLVGTTAAVIWEYYELVAERLAPASMRVGYTDTVVDLAAGMVGSAVAGALVLWWGRRVRGHR